jgi:hydroxyacylglutathione hydrolase
LDNSLQVVPIPAFQDNYIWLLYKTHGACATIVDPGDAAPVLQALAERHLILDNILITHHHADHQGGIPALLEAFPDIKIYGPAKEAIAHCSHPLSEGMHCSLPTLECSFEIWETPGHTLGHIAYVHPKMVFCGDTLFSAGCGRIFEGNPTQMFNSLERFKTLAPDTLIYCAHEYTLDNLKFAKLVEPSNLLIEEHQKKCEALRARNLPTLPSTMAIEQEINPFLRIEKNIKKNNLLKYNENIQSEQAVSIFAALREWKNTL